MCMDFLLRICGFLKLLKMEENAPTSLAKFSVKVQPHLLFEKKLPKNVNIQTSIPSGVLLLLLVPNGVGRVFGSLGNTCQLRFWVCIPYSNLDLDFNTR